MMNDMPMHACVVYVISDFPDHVTLREMGVNTGLVG